MQLQHPIHHAFFFFFFFFIILVFSFPNYSQSLTTHEEDEERGILLRLKQQYWGNPSSLHHWNSTSSPCHDDWPGISCNFGNGSVIEIYLPGMNINGSFPSKIICQLNKLSSINLNMNNLWGTIPVGLSTCSKLQELDLSANHFTGKIPGELFSIKTLRYLYLRENMLSGEILTPMVADSLEELDLSSNHLNGSIPDDIGNLYILGSLDLSRNSFTGSIPDDIGNLYILGSLDLSRNSFTDSIPDDIGNLYNLSYLGLSRNSLSGPIPARLLQLEQLSHLSLSFNKLTGEIPLPTHRVVYSLESLDLSSNHLNGSIPEDIGMLYNLGHLDLSHNHLSEPIPKGFKKLLQLEYMDVSNNQLSGDIWESVRDLTNVLIFNICLNNLSGRIPDELVKERFPDRCFDKANLCSDVKDEGLPACSTEWCSDDTIRGYINCSKSKKKNYIIIACGVIAGVLIWLATQLLVIRHAGERRMENDGEEEWSMISFQRLEFNKWDILGGLTDENLIGNGGSGKVYRVITKKGHTVAVKSIRHERKKGHILEKQFLAEVQILDKIWHKNIVKLLCYIRGNTTKLIVYEYMDKQCLYKWLHGKKKGITFVESFSQVLQWERRLKIAIGAAQGLCYLHHNCSPPIVHRDIKSSNILVDSEFNAKIADFGLAKMLASEGDPETASAIVGTFGYIAPEYGSTRKVNAKSDIYSFGVVLLELTTGREAVSANEEMNLAQWAHKHQREGNSAAYALDEEIKDPRYLEAMITVFKLGLACTLSSPSSRPSMKDISQILQRCSESNHLSSENQ